MKKLFTLLFFLVTVSLFTSCKKDDNNHPESLTGTVWQATEIFQEMSITTTLSFSATEFDYKEMIESSVSTDITGPYTYNAPDVVLIIGSEELNMRGTVNGNTLTLRTGSGTVKLVQIASQEK